MKLKIGDRVRTNKGEIGNIVRVSTCFPYDWVVDIEYHVDDYKGVMREPYEEKELRIINESC